MLVCDSLKGLTRYDLGTRRLEVLANEVIGEDGARRPIRYANDLDVARDGSVYFSTSTDAAVKRNAAGFYDTCRAVRKSEVRAASLTAIPRRASRRD